MMLMCYPFDGLQEPQLLEQMCMTMGLYELVAELRVRESLQLTNNTDRLREGSGRRLNAVAIGEAVHLLERAADYYSQVSASGVLGLFLKCCLQSEGSTKTTLQHSQQVFRVTFCPSF